jgi:hypothetical protein
LMAGEVKAKLFNGLGETSKARAALPAAPIES